MSEDNPLKNMVLQPEVEKRKRKYIPAKRGFQHSLADATIVPNIDALMNDALAIVGLELAQYRSKAGRGISLDLKEARAVQGYLDALVKLSRENREQARADDLANLSDEELEQLAVQLIGSKRVKALESDNEDDEQDGQ